MVYPVWITTDEIIGTIPENSFYEYQLEVTQLSGRIVTYTVVSGAFPPGISLEQRTGRLHGTAVVSRSDKEQQNYSYSATVRAAYSPTEITDRTFQIIINAVVPPIITPEPRILGAYFDGVYFYYDLNVIEVDPTATIQWSVITGSLPPGVSLNQNGELYGYLTPSDRSSETTYTVLNNRGSFDGLGWDDTPFSPPVTGVDANNATAKYVFGIRVFDGFNQDVNVYKMSVTPKRGLTADSVTITIDNTEITVNTTEFYNPIITNLVTLLPDARQDTDFIFRVTAIDYDDDVLTYALVEPGVVSFLPPGLTLDPATGWITGHLTPQIEDQKLYQFAVTASKQRADTVPPYIMVDYVSLPVTFSITILGEITNTVTWQTPEDLGTVFNGDVSEIQIKVVTPLNKGIRYTWHRDRYAIEMNDFNRTPNGIKLLESGLLVGRFPFNHFSVDTDATTFDKNKLVFDTVFNFTVHAEDYNHTVASMKMFTLKVINKYNIPYENIYMKGLIPLADREIFMSVINNKSIFPAELIYRPTDSNFGKASEIKFLFLPGLEPTKTEDYAAALQESHYTKRINLGEVKTAQAVDADLNVKYEVVYVDIIDNLSNNGQTLKDRKTLTTKNPYYDKNGTAYRDMSANSLYLMQKQLADSIGYSNKGALPDWMTSPQENGRVLGLTRAVVLAYTVPGASKLIAYRLQANGIVFNNLNFDVDRYVLDNNLSKNFDITNNKFYASAETTFDRVSHVPYSFKGSVTYATQVPYELINNRTTSYITGYGGIDSNRALVDGDTIVFVRQEQYTDINRRALSLEKYFFSSNNFDSTLFSAGEVLVSDVSLYDPNLLLITDPFDTPGADFDLARWPLTASEQHLPVTSPGAPGFDDTRFSATNNLVPDNAMWSSTSADSGWHDVNYPDETVPGEAYHILNPGTSNMRMGIWKINIDANDLVTLTYVKDILEYQYVFISSGQNFKETKLYFNPVVDTEHGFTVPAWSILTDVVKNSSEVTTCDKNATRFYSHRDMYSAAGVNDKYLKFQRTNIFQ